MNNLTINEQPSVSTKETSTTRRTGMLFVGQGAQSVGMTAKQLNIPEVASMYEQAEEILGYDLKAVVMEGPADTLSQTIYSQPALLIAGLAAVEQLRQTDPKALEDCAFVAGLSLGEYTAMVHAGAMSFADALRVVKVRAAAMHKAASTGKGTMMTVIGLEDAELETICTRASSKTNQPVQIANYLFPKGRVIGGSTQAVNAVEGMLPKRRGVLAKKLLVSGAFHTSMMSSAQDDLRQVLNTITINDPTIPIIANTTGLPVTSADGIRDQLIDQIVEPVLWEDSIKYMLNADVTALYDMGPRSQLKTMLRKISAAAWKQSVSVDVS